MLYIYTLHCTSLIVNRYLICINTNFNPLNDAFNRTQWIVQAHYECRVSNVNNTN